MIKLYYKHFTEEENKMSDTSIEYQKQWDIIVENRKKLYNAKEDKIQSEWETYCSELFSYKKYLGEIESKFSTQIGSHDRIIPDIVLNQNKKRLVDIELKQYNLSFSPIMEQQLISYLQLLHLSIGLLICNEAFLYYYDYSNDLKQKLRIPFEKDNENGIKLVELLNKENFDEEKIRAFIENQTKSTENINAIRDDLTQDNAKKIIMNFYSQLYPMDDVTKALDNYIIKLEKSNVITPGPDPIPQPTPDFPLNPSFIIIKTHWDNVNRIKASFNCPANEALYHATRYAWNVRYDKVIKYPYVLSVIDGKVQEVYSVTKWKHVDNDPVYYKPWISVYGNISIGRYEFYGEIAPDNIRNLWIGKQIPFKFRKKGLASPTLYSDQKD